MTPLAQYDVLDMTGPDAEAFLQGQLSSDVKSLTESGWQLSSYSTPKGRMLATFRVWRIAEGFRLQVAQDISAAILKRLRMFIMRSKVQAVLRDDLVLVGLDWDAAWPAAWPSTLAPDAAQDHAVRRDEPCQCLHLGPHHALLVLPADAAIQGWANWTATSQVESSAHWDGLEIAAGIPWVTLATQEQFVPQMANLDLVGAGISYTKGCYPGQEIVARTHYLGKVKRRMLRVRGDGAAPAVGTEVFSPEMAGQPSGQLLTTTAMGAESWEGLLVVQLSSVEHGLHVGQLDGPVLTVLDLPYPVH